MQAEQLLAIRCGDRRRSGGPAASEVDALWQFVERRGGTVVLLPDKVAGRTIRGTAAWKVVRASVQRAARAGAGRRAASEVVSMGVHPRGGRALATVDGAPVILSWPVGDGQIVFSGALDAWRYRADPKSRLGQFWRNELLSAAFNAPPPVRIDVQPAVVRPGECVRLNVRLRRTEWVGVLRATSGHETRLPAIEARVSDPSGKLETIRLWPDAETGTFRGEVHRRRAGYSHGSGPDGARGGGDHAFSWTPARRRRRAIRRTSQGVPALTGGVAVAAFGDGSLDPASFIAAASIAADRRASVPVGVVVMAVRRRCCAASGRCGGARDCDERRDHRRLSRVSARRAAHVAEHGGELRARSGGAGGVRREAERDPGRARSPRPRGVRAEPDGRAGSSPRSTARAVACVRGFYKFLAVEQQLESSPADDLRAPRAWPALPKFLDLDEVDRLLAQPDVSTPRGLRDKALISVLYATGLRVTELISLKAAATCTSTRAI